MNHSLSGGLLRNKFVWDHNPEASDLYKKCGYKSFRQGDGGMFMLKEM